MKAINILENKELEWSETDLPSIFDNDVLIKISATSVNRADVVQKNGFYPPPPGCLLYTSPSPRDRTRSRMPSSA